MAIGNVRLGINTLMRLVISGRDIGYCLGYFKCIDTGYLHFKDLEIPLYRGSLVIVLTNDNNKLVEILTMMSL